LRPEAASLVSDGHHRASSPFVESLLTRPMAASLVSDGHLVGMSVISD